MNHAETCYTWLGGWSQSLVRPCAGPAAHIIALGEFLQGLAHGRLRHVEDQTEGADLGSEDEGHPPIARLLVTRQGLDDRRRGRSA